MDGPSERVVTTVDHESTSLLSSQTSERFGDSEFCLNPWLISVVVTVLLLLPSLVLATIFVYELSGRLWPSMILSVHAAVGLGSACLQLKTVFSIPGETCEMNRSCRALTSLASLLDLYLCGVTYPSLAESIGFMFHDVDGQLVSEWTNLVLILRMALVGFHLVFWLRLLVGGAVFLDIVRRSSLLDRWTICRVMCDNLRNSSWRLIHYTEVWLPVSKQALAAFIWRWLLVLALLSVCWMAFCAQSCVSHLTDWDFGDLLKRAHLNAIDATKPALCCDDLDPTECALPFPSFHHMVRDETTTTGWRVALQSDSLPFLRGGVPLSPGFWNELDGFSTMAPILFYGLDGLKESQMMLDRGSGAAVYPGLVDSALNDSITERSITLLWDVERRELVPHTTQFDDIDLREPLIMLVPAQPLRHGAHYAVAVVNATNTEGKKISPTSGMKQLWGGAVPKIGGCIRDYERARRYQDVLIPSLCDAAPWLEATAPQLTGDIQLMFDFVTMSRDSLEPIERVRDATLEAVNSWKRHVVDIVKIESNNCHDPDTLIARTVHGNIQVPWFLESFSRSSILSKSRLPIDGSRLPMGWAKFAVRVPCSLRAGALEGNTTRRISRKLRAVVDYGHGLFFNRAESFEYSLARLAEDNGYLIMAMDWRGMSSFDIPVVMRTLLGQPNLFEATRDNIYQGYANKIVLQHYAKHEMLDANWLKFPTNRWHHIPLNRIPLFNENEQPSFVFYGASEGGILGAGYTTLLGRTSLIDRGILGVPGTSFSLVLSRSAEFGTYQSILLRNFYRNRQIRLILSIIQLGWDPVEAAGQLAPPLEPDSFPPMLLQSALGDPVIPRTATEALARAYNASILPNSPRTNIFGIPITNTSSSSRVIWTELLYKDAYQSLPVSNAFPVQTSTKVHACLRQDCPLMQQMAVFINTGTILDPCLEDGCLRMNISCHLPWMGINTKVKNWNCSCSSLESRATEIVLHNFCQ
jgi:hypothetical protein